jgi:haloacetate dehalogenase
MTDSTLFPGFQARRVEVDGVGLHLVCGGNPRGRALLLLHGHPQTHAIWHRVAPRLAERFFVVAADLRGYGDSDKVPGTPDHSAYAKRVMARDQVGLMRALGHERFLLCAHDRGARVGHRLCLDHPEAVEKAVFLDIAPTLAMYEQTSLAFARAYWHWFFLIQPEPLPERMIGVDPAFYVRRVMSRGMKGLDVFAPEALAEYLRCAELPGTVHAFCEDYRASAGLDLDLDRADRAAGRRMACPLRVFWGEEGVIGRCFDPLAIWREYAEAVEGGPFPCGHYMAEEAPERLLGELESFF